MAFPLFVIISLILPIAAHSSACLDNDNLRTTKELWFSNRVRVENEYVPIGSWSLCDGVSLDNLFIFKSDFNEDISEWDTSGATSMDGVFYHALSFNENISEWDVSNAQTMTCMFMYASAFNGDLSAWDVGKVTSMSYMFDRAISFNQDLGWCLRDRTIITEMFNESGGKLNIICDDVKKRMIMTGKGIMGMLYYAFYLDTSLGQLMNW
eukprot:CAMPEP_0194275534 /NCGR_PEP_ID=MMETSP0169-20130528/8348_1 /TAXON_ID=218684 /ORGANISM="Corethron pennatum, Strain L29A3" /LENGTH=208 /DNA_ID=CAMNT_0039019017 /DNA_START=51 /DNA_END=674 /DNA_ORIENTATION=+